MGRQHGGSTAVLRSSNLGNPGNLQRNPFWRREKACQIEDAPPSTGLGNRASWDGQGFRVLPGLSATWAASAQRLSSRRVQHLGYRHDAASSDLPGRRLCRLRLECSNWHCSFFRWGSLALRARIYPPNQTNLRFDLMLFSVGSSVTLKCNGGREMEGA